MFGDIVRDFLDAIFINFTILFVVSDECCQTVLTLQLSDLLMQYLDLLSNEVTYVDSFFPVIDFQFFVLVECLVHKFLLVVFKQEVDFFEDFLLVFHQLVVYTFPQSQNIIIYFVVAFAQFFEHYDVLIAFLFGIVDGLDKVDVGRFVVLDEVLFSMLDDAVGTEGHETLCIAAEVGKKFSGVVGAEYFFDFLVLRDSGWLYSGHGRQLSNY